MTNKSRSHNARQPSPPERQLNRQCLANTQVLDRVPSALRFSPTAWAKLVYLRDYGPTEVGGFAIAAEDDLLQIIDVQLVEQQCSVAHVAFDDAAVADFFDRQIDLGLRPERFARIWVHTHPGHSAQPSFTDDETFARVFGKSDWSIMFILAKQGQTSARLRFSAGPGGELSLPVIVNYSRSFAASDEASWQQEYLSNVQAVVEDFDAEFFAADPWCLDDHREGLTSPQAEINATKTGGTHDD